LQGSNDVPTKPEIFLDESYCHLHHTTPSTWVPHQGVVLAPGRGPLLVIFGAIAIMRNGNTNKLFGEIVPNSVLIWDPSIKPPTSKGRRRANASDWENLPESIRKCNIVADNVDYHGNFTADIFEDLFDNLCANVKELYGPTVIHMDGARYHKRRVEQVPTSNAKKAILASWLEGKGIAIPERCNKAELYALIKEHKQKVPFACVEIAKKHSHQLCYTPPYHCELQPIEGVWAVVKRRGC
jgi:DDE superfamily endonuclease